ncbi:MAG: hypothetical protein IAE78_05600 [Myxococcus sp.]|nr:hypothetical protein [Myxococcus sp.]
MAAVGAARRRHLRRVGVAFTGACLLAGFLVRAWGGWHGYFADDESLFWATGVQLARGEIFPLVGPPISGSPAGLPGPLFYWVCALPALVSPHPYAQSLFYALLSQLGVLAFAAIVRRWWGLRTAAVFLALSIAMPYLVAYADRIWAGNLFFPLAALVAWLTSRLVARPTRRAEAFVLGALAVAMPQLHLSTVHLVLLAGVALLAFRVRVSFRWLVAGAVVGALFYTPYLVHELRTGFSNTLAIRAHAAGAPERTVSALGSLYASFFGLATTDLSYLFARGYWYSFNHFTFWKGNGVATMSQLYEQAGSRPVLWLSHGLTWLLQLCGLVVLIVRVFRRRRVDLPTLFLFVALADITALYLLSGKSGYVHYTTIVLPLALLPMLAVFRAIPRRAWRFAAPALLAVVLSASGLVLHHFYLGLEGTIPDQLAIVRRVHQERAGRPWAFVGGSQWIFGNAYARLSDVLEKTPWTPQATAAPADTFVVFTRKDWDVGPRPGLVPIEVLPHLVLTRVVR